MGRTDKEWRLPADYNYRGKITMMEVKTFVKEFNKDIEKPEIIVDNSGEFAQQLGVNMLNIKAENGGNPSRKDTKKEDTTRD